MKKISLLLCFLLSFSALANCEDAYELAANKRAKTTRIVSYGISFSSPLLILASGGLGAVALVGLIGGHVNAKTARPSRTTFGKVLEALRGNPSHVAKKLAKKFKFEKNDPEFVSKIQTIVADLNQSQEACPYMGYDKKFKDIYQVYNLKKFSKIVEAEYLQRFGKN